MTFTIRELARYLRTKEKFIYAACQEASVGIRWEVNPEPTEWVPGRPQPLTEEEARAVIRVFHSRKARAKLSGRSSP